MVWIAGGWPPGLGYGERLIAVVLNLSNGCFGVGQLHPVTTACFTKLKVKCKIHVYMSRFRYLLLCLMMLALPLQGFAAASMLYCGMGAGHTAKAKQMNMSSSHYTMADAMGMQHDHSKHDKIAQTDEQSPDGQKQLPDATHKCGACSACCNIIAISDFPQTVKLQPVSQAVLTEFFVSIHSAASRLPEKPPRA